MTTTTDGKRYIFIDQCSCYRMDTDGNHGSNCSLYGYSKAIEMNYRKLWHYLKDKGLKEENSEHLDIRIKYIDVKNVEKS